jgi:gamma-glutamylcyclotransferase (GGCT)/AIG2-like uncharacterized protein YtfP
LTLEQGYGTMGYRGGEAVNLFAYGTLMDRRVMTRVCGRPLPAAVPATLFGYRMWETSLGYPIILPEPGASCPGVVYYSLTPTDWERLDAYEDAGGNPPAYFRRLVTAQGAHGKISTYVYVGNLNYFRTRIKY